MQEQTCKDCGEPMKACVCCQGCGHVCPLDMGEPFCPICKPEPAK